MGAPLRRRSLAKGNLVRRATEEKKQLNRAGQDDLASY